MIRKLVTRSLVASNRRIHSLYSPTHAQCQWSYVQSSTSSALRSSLRSFASTSVKESVEYVEDSESSPLPRKKLSRWARIARALVVMGALGYGFAFYVTWSDEEMQHRLLVNSVTWSLFSRAPLRAWSQFFGIVMRTELPPFLRAPVYLAYGTLFRVHMDQVPRPLTEYPSLAEFFARSIDAEIRPMDETEAGIVAPCDGRVLHCGVICSEKQRIEQVKGNNFRIEALLGQEPKQNGDSNENARDKKLMFMTIYLSPGDYHNFHNPFRSFAIDRRRHFGGHLFPVSPHVARILRGLFACNERVVFTGSYAPSPDSKYFGSVVAVGATDVGAMTLVHEPEFSSNAVAQWDGSHGSLEEALTGKLLSVADYTKLEAKEEGDLLGGFRMGSTIVIVFETRKEFEFDFHPGQIVHLGQSLGHFASS